MTRVSKQWTADEVAFLSENYPQKGKLWCAEKLGLKEHQVRHKASVLGLVARGISEAWQNKQVEHAKKLTGRKRPEQAEVIRAVRLAGKLDLTPERLVAVGKRMRDWIAENGHPRGMQGKKHSADAALRMSASGIRRHAKASAEEKMQRAMKMVETKSAKGNLINQRTKVTWKGGWREIGGKHKFFRSRWEANYARYLESLKEKGQIKDWFHEAKTFLFVGVTGGNVSYSPDFLVIETNGDESFHEVKGWMDERSKIKIQRMGEFYPEVALKIVDSLPYKELERTVGRLIHSWEQKPKQVQRCRIAAERMEPDGEARLEVTVTPIVLAMPQAGLL